MANQYDCREIRIPQLSSGLGPDTSQLTELPPIKSHMGEIGKAMDALKDVVDRLSAKVVPIMAGENSSVPSSYAPPRGGSPFAVALCEHAQHLQHLRAQLEDIVERIEI
jgi:hypothetical protein